MIFHEGTKLAKMVFSWALKWYVGQSWVFGSKPVFIFCWISFLFDLDFSDFHKYSDFESKEERFFVSFVIISLFSLPWEKLAENIIEFHSLQLFSQMVTQSLELTTNPWSRNISKLKQSFGNWRNLLCVVFAGKGRTTYFSAVVTGLVSFVQRSLVSAIFARSVLTRNYAYFDCVWCHGGLFFNTTYTIYWYAMKAR